MLRRLRLHRVSGVRQKKTEVFACRSSLVATTERRYIGTLPIAVSETLFFAVPSPSPGVVDYQVRRVLTSSRHTSPLILGMQWWDNIKFFKRLRAFIVEVAEGGVDASRLHALLLGTTRSILCILKGPSIMDGIDAHYYVQY